MMNDEFRNQLIINIIVKFIIHHSSFIITYLENLENFLLNLSIRPAVSTNFILPVKNGCENAEISILINGYSLPSVQVILSFELTAERVKKASSLEMSRKTTMR
jgi:hypothetical protein